MAYTGYSIVDYLKSVGKPSDYSSRSQLASQYGIGGYSGSAGQNTQLLNLLRSGGSPTQPTPDVPPTPPQPSNIPTGPQPITTESNWQQLYIDALNKLNTSQSSQQPWADINTQYREQLGIPGMEATQKGITGQVSDVEGLLDRLENDINTRASTVGGVMTESQLRRRQAAEGKPLREQLTGLYKSQATGQTGLLGARQELASMMQLEEQQRQSERANTLGMLPYYQQALAQPEPEKGPTSYQEWTLAGSPGTYEEWIRYQAPKAASSGGSGGGGLKASDTEIRNWMLKSKRENPNAPYYDLWGQLSDELKRQGLNPSNYDKLFWEILHPEGEAGYKKYASGTEGDEDEEDLGEIIKSLNKPFWKFW